MGLRDRRRLYWGMLEVGLALWMGASGKRDRGGGALSLGVDGGVRGEGEQTIKK